MNSLPLPTPKNGSFLFCRGRAAFSLIEVLVVLSIIGVLTVLLIPASNSVLRTYKLSSASQTLVGQLTMARQLAVTRGHAVQVRLYYLPDYNQDAASGTPAVFRGMQCFTEGEAVSSGAGYDTPLTAVTKPVFFNDPVVLLDDNSKSTLLSLAKSAPTADRKLPNYQTNYKYVSFRFKPDGQTDLLDTQTGLTLMLKGDALDANGIPANFRSIEIDIHSGSVRSYSP